MLVDSHCHLDLLLEEHGCDINELISAARNCGVEYLLNISTSVQNFSKSLGFAKNFDNIFCSMGVHPMHIEEKGGIITFEELSSWLHKHERVVAIGETGFDFYRVGSEKNAKNLQYKLQMQNLDIHISAAQKYNLPIIIHTRAADDETIEFLTKRYKEKQFRGVIHCFSSTKRLAFKMMDIGFYISASGISTFKNAEDIRETLRQVPQDMLLVETDAPYLAPVPMRGKVNYPEYIWHTAKFLANLRGEEFETFCVTTTNNFFKLFDKAKKV